MALAFAGAVAISGGCSSSSSSDGGRSFGGTGGGSGSSAAGGDGGSAGGPTSGAGGLGGAGGTGGSVIAGGAGGAGGSGGVEPDAACTEVTEKTENKVQPADIIVAIDQSGSMDQETQWVQAQLNGFANQITNAGIDVYVAMIAVSPVQPRVQTQVTGAAVCDVTENPLCVPQPLAGAGCIDNLPLFKSVNCHVDSHDALYKIVGLYDEYKAGLRVGAQKHVIVISDDESNMGAVDFDDAFRALDPQLEGYVFHGIFSFADSPNDLDCVFNPVPCCGVSAGEGQVYRQLTQMRGGIAGDLCVQNFQPIWDAVSQQVVASSTIACEWDIPAPPSGMVDPQKVNVEFIGSGMKTTLGYVTGAADCGNFQNGWYYDDNANPTKVFACADTCQLVQGEGAVEVNLRFGCATEIAIPR